MVKEELEELNRMADQTLMFINIAYKVGKLDPKDRVRRIKAVLQQKAELSKILALV